MELLDLLPVFIEVSVAFVGFAGVVAALSRPQAWGVPETIAFEQLLTLSAGIFFLSALPLVLTAQLGPAIEENLWRVTSSAFILLLIFMLWRRTTQYVRSDQDTPPLMFVLTGSYCSVLGIDVYLNTSWGYTIIMLIYFLMLFMNFGKLVIKFALDRGARS